MDIDSFVTESKISKELNKIFFTSPDSAGETILDIWFAPRYRHEDTPNCNINDFLVGVNIVAVLNQGSTIFTSRLYHISHNAGGKSFYNEELEILIRQAHQIFNTYSHYPSKILIPRVNIL